jgi:hypothetical protein
MNGLNLRTMTNEELCLFARSTSKVAASPVIGELVKRLEKVLDATEKLQEDAASCGIDIAGDSLAKPPIICNTCGAKV